MSGPAGSGTSGGKGKGTAFANVIGNVLHKSPSQRPNGEAEDGVGTSKHLPSTGLKRNTKEWKDAHQDEEEDENSGSGSKSRARRSSQSSSSSLPSDVNDHTDNRTDAEQENGQERADGSGPGRHEDHIPDEDEDSERNIYDSPTEESPTSAKKHSTLPSHVNTKHRTRDQDDDEGENVKDDMDPEEKVNRRDSRPEKRKTDELGRRPDGLPGVKDEESPGPRNEIVLDPRISHMNYHGVKESTVTGLKRGPILKITPDGEGEYPPGETPRPSRTASAISVSMSRSGSSDHEMSRAPRERERDEANHNGGTWRSAMQGSSSSSKKDRKSVARFSSFRDDAPEESGGEAEAEDGSHQNGNGSGPEAENAQKKWALLRQRVLPQRTSTTGGAGPGPGKVSALSHTAIGSVPITAELLVGQLPVMMLKTWLDRDEDGHRAVPVLLGNLRFRVGDSVGLRQGRETGKEMFKLECEYGDGVVKWVIYRELRDFLSLHAHYKAANFGTSVPGLRASRKVEIPDFPRMSKSFYASSQLMKIGIPYLSKFGGWDNKDREKAKPVGKAEYAQASRDALQQYLVELIRAVIFRPESNRLCKFFELSALTLTLAPRGGFQGKAGFLKIPGANASRRANQPGLTPMSWKASRDPKWFIVRDTYFVATDGPESTDYYDVFLLDSDFTIERPKRYYRTGFHLISGHGGIKSLREKGDDNAHPEKGEPNDMDLDNPLNREVYVRSGEGKGSKAQNVNDESEQDASQHTFFIINSQRRLKLVAKNARQMHQFIVSMERIAAQSVWTGRNRFDSFAPLRVNVAAQWLVDGRDYFWNLSRAINMAKDRIYIHDWWISPELYLRRPGDERYRLDNLLKRKAEDGVKIFIIIYNEVSDKTTPVDSVRTKKTLSDLHPNIMVQRSPSHFQTGTFYWSHHEKLCVIDETIAFMGGLDLCFGRWDTSQHILTDDDHTAPDGPDGPVWRGKDYSNERVMEYSNLDKPFEDMFDRSKVPRMPWHDVGLQIVGQPARDLCRHFVQRWNLLIRTKNHKRRMPFLLPAADFTDRELADLKLRGTCEVQICRSVGPWSMGTLTKIEHSIQNAYCKSIQTSEHFVYIENQFFITSTIVDGVKVENGIGDALVERIIRAHKEGTEWRACIVIPLLPGYTYPIDSGEASSVRMILECQNRTICRGTHSIFSRLRKEGIQPDDYITFFSLRGWAKFKSGALTTEQVYIHGKTMIVDDRLVLCGSANINERSQRGDRDSELLAVIRDTDMIDGTMAGRPFKVGRFAHTLRVRLMREHVGVDVDSIDEDQLMSREPIADADEVETWDPDHEQQSDDEERAGITKVKRTTVKSRLLRTFENGMSSVTKGVSENVQSNVRKAADKVVHPIAAVVGGQTAAHHLTDNGDPSEREDYDREGRLAAGFASSIVPTLEEKTIYERRPSATHANGKPLFDVMEESEGGHGQLQTETEGGEEDALPNGRTVGEQGQGQKHNKNKDGTPSEAQVPGSVKKSDLISDEQPSAKQSGAPTVYGSPEDKEMYGSPANANTNDDEAPTKGTNRRRDSVSKEEEQAVLARKTLRKHLNAKTQVSPWSMPTPTPKINPNRFHDPLDERFWKDMWVAVAVHNTEIFRKVFRCIPDDLVTSWAQYKAFANHAEKFNKEPEDVAAPGHDEPVKVTHNGPGTHGAGGGGSGGGEVQAAHPDSGAKGSLRSDKEDGQRSPKPSAASGEAGAGAGEHKNPSGPDDAWHEWERSEMEALLNEVRGHLVLYSTRFLEAEDLANNFLFNSDKILPLPIFD